MIQSRIAIGNQVLKYAMTGVAVSCLGAAVFAAPLTITPKAKVFSAQRKGETKAAFAPLGQGPAFQLGHAAASEDEDCVRVNKGGGSRWPGLCNARLDLPGIGPEWGDIFSSRASFRSVADMVTPKTCVKW